ncbi:MAG: hypothetical protein U0163_10645 [Gemmatimonadaceae bacterium]
MTEHASLAAAPSSTATRKLAQLIDRCLAKDPAQRPSDAEELAQQIGAAVEQRRGYQPRSVRS